MFRIRVVDEDLQSVGNVLVKLEFCSVWPDMAGIGWTDKTGFAEFEGFENGDVLIFVNGCCRGTYCYRDGFRLIIRIP